MKKIFTVLLLALIVESASAADFKTSPWLLQDLQKSETVDALIFLKDQADVSDAVRIIDRTQRIQFVYDKLTSTALTSQVPVIEFIKAENLTYQSFHLVNAILVEKATAEQIERISQLAQVQRIERDQKSRLKMPPQPKSNDALTKDATAAEPTDGIKQIKAEKAWALGFKGAGIVVAGQDTGYDWNHTAIKNQYRGFSSMVIDHNYNWHDSIRKGISGKAASGKCGYNSVQPCDDQSHGTHTMGTMIGLDVGTENNKIGVAPEAKWIGCRNMDSGVGRASTYLECFEYFLAPYPINGDPKTEGRAAMAPHVINNSWGCPKEEGCGGDEFALAIDHLHAAGIMVVASAGNDGPGCRTLKAAPGFYSGKLLSVASSDSRTGNISSFSSRGPSAWNEGLGPNITAPGGNVRSSVPGGGYSNMSGTSMAGPHVAGAVALLWSAKPSLIGNIQGTIDLIQQTASARTSSQKCGSFSGLEIPNAVFGYGIIDIEKAIQQTR